MQFAEPDWKPTQAGQSSPTYTPQPVNDDRRERSQQPVVEAPPEQEEVYGGYAPVQPEQFRQAPYQYPQMPYRRRRPRVWLWVIIAIIFFSLLGGGVSSLGSIGQRSVSQNLPTTALATGIPTIIINELSGNIHVNHGGSLNIQDVKKSSFFDDPNNINVKVDYTGSTITINVDEGSSLWSSRSVDFNITVPGNANLQLDTTSGDINVDNTSGAMSLTSTSGNITTANDAFVGKGTLHTTSGDIHSAQDVFNGYADVSTTSGDISMNQDALNSSANVSDTSGDINFDGTLASSSTPDVSYQFTTVSGDISVGVPVDANVAVQSNTTSGSIDAGDFPGISVQDTNQGSGSQASGTIGNPSGATLTLHTTSGDITIHQR